MENSSFGKNKFKGNSGMMKRPESWRVAITSKKNRELPLVKTTRKTPEGFKVVTYRINKIKF